MQQPPNHDYSNWLRIQDGQLAMEEAQLVAEEQWLNQEIWMHNNNTGSRVGQALLFGLAKSYRSTPWQRRAHWLSNKRNELTAKRAAIQARRNWLQQEKWKYGLP